MKRVEKKELLECGAYLATIILAVTELARFILEILNK
jgi:hypothetical protein